MAQFQRKKQKLNNEIREISPLNEELFSEQSIQELRDEHNASGPYKHLVLKSICKDDQMRKIHDEVVLNMKADFKETDLFKVFQTGELSSIDANLASIMPRLLSLRAAIYSPEFRNFVSQVLGCSGLTDRIDCSANAYANGCHLLCHDDVIGTRCVSYIIYLPDPDDAWTPQDGGAVELYPLEESSAVIEKTNDKNNKDASTGPMKQGVPNSLPTKNILPSFNTMLMFTVQPGRSYHSVQEVFSSKPRFSISGWYHASTPPPGADMSSLKQIMTLGDDHRVFNSFSAEVASSLNSNERQQEAKLTKKEHKQLNKWINSNYLTEAAMKDINEQFCANSSLQLDDFLKSDVAYELTKICLKADHEEDVGGGKAQLDYTKGTSTGDGGDGKGWQLVGPPHKRRHLIYETPTNTSTSTSTCTSNSSNHSQEAGRQLDQVRTQLFESAAFAKYLEIITSLVPTGHRNEVRRFRAGLDYTVAHYGVLTQAAKLDATLCFVNDDNSLARRILGSDGKRSSDISKKEQEKENGDDDQELEEEAEEEEAEEDDYGIMWEGGDVGGFECYIEAEEDPENSEAAEVYRSAESRTRGEKKEKKRDDNGNGNGKDEDDEKADEENAETSLLSVSASNNTFNLVLRDEGVMKFVKYVSANAPGSRWDITNEYEILPPEDDDGDDDDDEEEEED